MKTILTVLIAFNSILVISQTDTEPNKYTHTLFLGQPTNFESDIDFELSAHYTIGYMNKKNKHREVQLGYRFTTYALANSFLSNGQLFYLLHGGRRYFSAISSKKFKPYFNWHYGIAIVNSEEGDDNYFGLGNTIPLPDIALGLYTEIGQRFDVGFTLEGVVPVAYFRLGYKLY